MHELYSIVSGPLVWIALLTFILGSTLRLWQLYRLARCKENFIFSFFNLKYSLRSLAHWTIPFGARNMRIHPVMTIAAFAFHICVIIVPLFLLSHIVLWEEAWGLKWWAVPTGVADVMTLVVIAACAFFLVRRFYQPEVRYVTSASDFILLALVAAPFITGFYCNLQLPGYRVAFMMHMLSGEALLIAVPFTRLRHMFYAVFTRSYIGSEFGSVRHAKDW